LKNEPKRIGQKVTSAFDFVFEGTLGIWFEEFTGFLRSLSDIKSLRIIGYQIKHKTKRKQFLI